MKLIITDTNVLFDVIKIGALPEFFSLDYDICTTVFVIEISYIACEKLEIIKIIKIETLPVSTFTSTEATLPGNIIDPGEGIIECGHYWWEDSDETTPFKTVITIIKIGKYTSTLSNLQPATTYYTKAYATDVNGNVFGKVLQFTTRANFPSVATSAVSNITSTSAQSGGNVINDGGAPVTVRGVCWSTIQSPTLANSKTNDSAGIGTFISSITDLSPGTTYYVRAYAINRMGTAYGKQDSFITIQNVTIPIVNTSSVTCGGNITSSGGAIITARGVCWSLSEYPTISDSFTINGSGTGSFYSDITGLEISTTYYVRAYATNSIGTAYGGQIKFLTLPENIDAVINKIPEGMVPIIDGVEDELWNLINPQAIEKNYNAEAPTVTAYWKALWNDTAIFVLLNVADNDHWTSEQTGGLTWQYDKPEVWFDINEVLADGNGPENANTGHWQVAPDFKAAEEGVEILTTGSTTGQFADNYHSFRLYGEGYVFEYRLPIIKLYDKDKKTFGTDGIVNKIIGFDVTIIDQDEGITDNRQRKVWKNIGTINESWINMDECGIVIFH